MGNLRALAARLRAAAAARHATEPEAGGAPPPPADDAADLAHEAAVMQAAREAEAAGTYPTLPEAEHRAALVGLMRAALMRPPSWPAAAATRPTPGAWCGACGGNQRPGASHADSAGPPGGNTCAGNRGAYHR